MTNVFEFINISHW